MKIRNFDSYKGYQTKGESVKKRVIISVSERDKILLINEVVLNTP